jgi:deoxyhypusine monooxygenase
MIFCKENLLGQIQSPAVIDELEECLSKLDENYMVRHEAAEALGAIATKRCQELLEIYALDKEVKS